MQSPKCDEEHNKSQGSNERRCYDVGNGDKLPVCPAAGWESILAFAKEWVDTKDIIPNTPSAKCVRNSGSTTADGFGPIRDTHLGRARKLLNTSAVVLEDNVWLALSA